jgi:muconolactone D-isomerase
MLFAVRMDVALPDELDVADRSDLIAREKAYSLTLQADGEWVSIWRIAGKYANLSIFDVNSNDRLHEILWNLPLFRYMTIEVIPLAQHPSDKALAGSSE